MSSCSALRSGCGLPFAFEVNFMFVHFRITSRWETLTRPPVNWNWKRSWRFWRNKKLFELISWHWKGKWKRNWRVGWKKRLFELIMALKAKSNFYLYRKLSFGKSLSKKLNSRKNRFFKLLKVNFQIKITWSNKSFQKKSFSSICWTDFVLKAINFHSWHSKPSRTQWNAKSIWKYANRQILISPTKNILAEQRMFMQILIGKMSSYLTLDMILIKLVNWKLVAHLQILFG